MIDRRTFVSLMLGTLTMPVALTACGSSSDEPAASESQTQIANPFVDCESASEAAQLAGFEVTFPESVPGCSERLYQAVEGEMVQCIYSSGDTEVLIRKGMGTDDISGDYTDYGEVNTVDVAGTEVTEKGEDGLVFAATWVRDGFAFAIDANEGLDAETIGHLAQATL